MRLSETQIREAILHSENEVRVTAARFFRETHSRDATLLPQVIEAVRRYGREGAFSLVRAADEFVVTPDAVSWAMDELRTVGDRSNIFLDNYRFAIALLLCDPCIAGIAERCDEILTLPGFPTELRATIADVGKLARCDWQAGWNEFLAFGRHLSRKHSESMADSRRRGRIVRTLGRFADEGGEVVVKVLAGTFRGRDRALVEWMAPWFAGLAGEMRLREAIPHLIDRMIDEDDEEGSPWDDCGLALGRIGTNDAVKAISHVWADLDEYRRIEAAEALTAIRSERCLTTCLALLAEETDDDVSSLLGNALLNQFDTRGIEAVRHRVRGNAARLSGEMRALRHELTAVATLMNFRFPDYERWLQEARRENWGWPSDSHRGRIAENFRTDGGEEGETIADAIVRLTASLAAGGRPSLAKIRDAILHPEPEARRMAVRWFTGSFMADRDVMPRIIEAASTFGRESAVTLLRQADQLPQSEETVDWMLRELAMTEISGDYRQAVERVLSGTDPALLDARTAEVERVLGADPLTLAQIRRRLSLRHESPGSLWKRLEDLCEESHEADDLDEVDLPLGNDIVEALARHGEDVRARCLEILEQDVDAEDDPIFWMIGHMVQLAGLLRLDVAVDPLVACLNASDDWLPVLAAEALARIGTDDVVNAVVDACLVGDWEFRLFAGDVLSHIRSDLATAACQMLLEFEDDPLLQSRLAAAWLDQLVPAAIEPVRKLIDEHANDTDFLDLCESLVGAAALLNVPIPDRNRWRDHILFRRTEIRRRSMETREHDDEEMLEEETDWGDLEGDRLPTGTIFNTSPRVGRNDPCPCGSGKKYKKCCLPKKSGNPEWN